ncbi:MAG TPA: GTP-binding protein [Alphaproteobacteria bacterium]|nr:GTP-binding protein [Alphaproteobacteria bacterium]
MVQGGMMANGKIPVSILTGFLGSGKTTLLNRLVRHPDMARALVVINEFGEIGLDHDLVERATDDMVLLQSGCLCCTVRSDVIETLLAMLKKAKDGEIAPFERVVIETTGLADPAPILQAFMSDAQMTRYFALDGVIATIDAVAGAATLDRHIEAVKQAAVADRLLITKSDLPDADVAGLSARLAALNPGAPIELRDQNGDVSPRLLFDVGLYDPSSKSIDVRRWLDAEKYPAHEHHEQGHHGHEHAHAENDVNRHDAHIRAVCLTFDAPIPGETLDRWLSALLRLKGPDLLRFKAIVNVAELPGPLVLHGVQHVIHPPLGLKEWPSDDRRTRMVFITYDIDEQTLRDSFREGIASAA